MTRRVIRGTQQLVLQRRCLDAALRVLSHARNLPLGLKATEALTSSSCLLSDRDAILDAWESARSVVIAEVKVQPSPTATSATTIDENVAGEGGSGRATLA